MPSYTIRESGGDFPSLALAVADAGTVDDDLFLVQGSWSSADSSPAVFNDRLTIRAEGEAKYDPRKKDNPTHYRLRCTSGAHCITLNSDDNEIDGIEIIQASTASSAEGVRISSSGAQVIKNCGIRAASDVNQQDGIYRTTDTILNIINCDVEGFNRGGIHLQNYGGAGPATAVVNINSSTFHRCGIGGSFDSGGIVMTTGAAGSVLTFNILNTIVTKSHFYSAKDYCQDGAQGTTSWNIVQCIDSDGSISARDPSFIRCLLNRTSTDSPSPGAGDWVMQNQITNAPYDLTLQDDPVNNDAQEMDTENTGAGMTIPATDVLGTPRSSPYDCGFFTILGGVGPIILSVDDVSHGHTLDGDLGLQQGVGLSVDDTTHMQLIEGGFDLGQKAFLAVADALHGHVLEGDLSLSAGDVVSPDDTVHGHTVEGGLGLGTAFTLNVAEALHGHAMEGDLVLGQKASLVVADMDHSHLLEGDLGFGQSTFLVVADNVHGHALDGGLGLGQAAILGVANMFHGHTAEGGLVLGQKAVLVVSDVAHAHTLEGNLNFGQGVFLSVADILHGHFLEGPLTMVQATIVALVNVAHGHAIAGNLSLSPGYTLLVADNLHGHGVESPVLIEGQAMGLADVFHGHSLDGGLGLSQSSILVPGGNLHGHTLDGTTLIPGFTLAVADTAHSHLVESPVLMFGTLVNPADVIHSHLIDGINLSQSHILVVDDALHTHQVDQTILIAGEFEPGCVTQVPIESRLLVIPIENRSIKIKLC